ncbi:hypothetical protein [Nocardia crassostreae]|uniref:hypothetical protein n=1 Tax=Nocardia crassostreae TaxID=53428 RepID=UPI001C3F92A2|nr:hypothetical protein [Nocardia crassostreae]
MATILTFWLSTVATELTGSEHAVTTVKQTIPWALPILVLALAVTGASGFRLADHSADPVILAKKRRMPIIAANGLLILVPCAITLSILARRDQFGAVFYCIQALELLVGATNIVLMSLNIRDGLQLTGHLSHRNKAAAHRPASMATNPRNEP